MLTLEEFESVLHASERSKHTIRSYVYALSEFFSMYKEPTVMNINKYLMKLQEKTRSQMTKYIRYMALKKYCKLSSIDIDWEAVVKPKMQTKFTPSIFTLEEVTEVINSIENPNLKLLFMTGYECCCRPSELCQLTRDDVDLQRGTIRVKGLKGSNTALIPVSGTLINELREHIKRRAAQKSFPLFVSKWKRPYDPNYLSSVVFKTAVRKSLGLKRSQETNLHGFFRHSRITHLFQQKSDGVDVNYIARHKSMQMTMRYTHLEPEDVAARLGSKLRPPWGQEQASENPPS